MKLSKRILEIQPSATISISAKAKAMKAEGKPVLSFSVGEPDFNSPECASKAAIEAIQRGESHYTLNSGIIELRKEVCNYYKRRFGLEYAPDEVLVAPGAKPLLYEALQMFVDPGDEVLLFSPAWVSYVEQIHLAGGKEAIVDTLKTDLIPTKEAIEAVLSDKTVGMIINSPSNPTGAIYGEETLKMIADIARERDLWIIFDEIYERLAYAPANHINILSVAPDLRDKTILVNGASKAYAMTGWRIGYALGPKALIAKMNTLQTHLTSNASSIAQWAAWGAVKDADPDVEKMREAFEERRSVILGLIRDMPYVKVRDPEGAFYVFIDVRESPIPDDMEFCEKLLEEKYVAAVPGTAFFAPGFVRFSYACSMENIREGMGRLKEFLSSL
ncbi:MAG TPA: pyridoxal phosphate-dependent aminotransferase [Synergistaceae bacterium]|mgnify:FL=1|jgi:aspartate aminotransferase|nr:pyridoxal phosphate-dependent aminotransferase [Synergistaceae bacterium]NLL40515.1 pyridoxal phosphate-dependent aminotransferase [Synergistaceae bacterium]HPX04053.1 pyridoxal phosphate-dependent aminotransferase [Synergistaceae bacterium]HQA54956.1 pyridoxal phosphate-dependent aminotransferase [Synergistaceae bacterium]